MLYFDNVLIVAKCIVNSSNHRIWNITISVLIVAKCIVNANLVESNEVW